MTALALERDDIRHMNMPEIIPNILNAADMAYAFIDKNLIIRHAYGDIAGILGLGEDVYLEGSDLIDLLEGFRLENSETHLELNKKTVSSLMNQSMQSSKPHRTTVRITTPEGRRVRANCWYDGRGNCTLIVRDTTTAASYRNSFEIAMEAANAGFWSIDFKTGKFTYSASVTNRLTASEQEMLQKNGLFAIIHPEDLKAITAEWGDVVAKRRDFDFKYRVRLEKADVMWQRSIGQITCAPDGTPLGATAFVMDITEDVDINRALEEEKQTSKAKSEFLARMSHEIRTPLNAIIGMSDSLKEEDISDEVREVVQDIEDAADGLNHLLSRTLDHAKMLSESITIEPRSVDPHDLLATVTRLWKPQISVKGLQFRTIIDPDLPKSLHLDDFRLQQCLNNLLSNAAKFTKTGSIYLIARMAKINGLPNLVLVVKDTGIGMSESEADRIFEPFTQADGSIQREFGGTGLGMTITRDLCELMGGTIKLQTALGEGSTFALVLPVRRQAEEPSGVEGMEASKIHEKPADVERLEVVPPPLESSPEAPKPFEGLNVLCVEDNLINQRVVKRLIGKRVAALYFADNGREALEALNTVPVDVVLMDIHMPVMDGIETTLEIRKSNEAYANVVIIALTADPDYQHLRICRNIGMNDTIAKPVRREDILEAFDRNLGTLFDNFGQEIAISA